MLVLFGAMLWLSSGDALAMLWLSLAILWLAGGQGSGAGDRGIVAGLQGTGSKGTERWMLLIFT